MSRSAIYTVNNTTQAVAVNGTIGLGTVNRRFGSNLSLVGNAIRECGTGYYKYCANFSVAPTAAGSVTVTAYKDGVAIPGAVAIGSTTTAGNPINLAMTFVTRENCACCDDAANISFVLTGTASNIGNAAVVGEKL